MTATGGPIQFAGTGAPTITAYEGATYQREDVGDVYVGRAGVWVSLLGVTLTGPAGGDLAGTYPNPTVIGLHGTLGVVDMQGHTIRWRADQVSMTLVQDDQTSNFDPGAFLLQLSAPWASATGINRNAPSGRFVIPAPAAGGAAGRWAFDVSGLEKFAVEETGVMLSAPNIRFAASVSNPAISQDRAVGDVAGQDMGISPQLPSLSSTGANQRGRSLILSSSSPVGGADHGWIELRVSGTPTLNVEVARLLLGSAVTHIDFASTTLGFRTGGVTRATLTASEFKFGSGVSSIASVDSMNFQPDAIASVSSGRGISLTGGRNTAGVGGELRLTGGEGATAADDGVVRLKLWSGFSLMLAKINGQSLLTVGTATPSTCPADGVEGGIFIGDALSVGDTGEPNGGFYLASVGGRPFFWIGDATPTKLIVNGGLQASIPAANYGALWVDLIVGGVLHEVAIPLGLR